MARQMAATVVVSSAAGLALTWLHRARTKGEHPPAHVVLPVASFPTLDELGPPAA
jgi:hypothetical protein